MDAVAFDVQGTVILIEWFDDVPISDNIFLFNPQRFQGLDNAVDRDAVSCLNILRGGTIGLYAHLDQHPVGHHVDNRRAADLNRATGITDGISFFITFGSRHTFGNRRGLDAEAGQTKCCQGQNQATSQNEIKDCG